jgi:hypothetical protein
VTAASSRRLRRLTTGRTKLARKERGDKSWGVANKSEILAGQKLRPSQTGHILEENVRTDQTNYDEARLENNRFTIFR